MLMSRLHKLADRQSWSYLADSLRGCLMPSRRHCPCCNAQAGTRVSRKSLIFSLVRCDRCRLLFRVPRDSIDADSDFYQEDYASGGLATHLPDTTRLAELLDDGFRGTDKDFSTKLNWMRDLSAGEENSILDYGCSWGYATWQFRRAGFDAVGYEVSRPRALFGTEKLGVEIYTDLDKLDRRFDFIFTSHVLEHVADPRTVFDLARDILNPGGYFLAFTPNGSEQRLQADRNAYNHSWGRLHPIYLDERFYDAALGDGATLVTSRPYGQWADRSELLAWDRRSALRGDLRHPELLLIWRVPG